MADEDGVKIAKRVLGLVREFNLHGVESSYPRFFPGDERLDEPPMSAVEFSRNLPTDEARGRGGFSPEGSV
jgi:hypothetical protein